jgi:hypothetical protein
MICCRTAIRLAQATLWDRKVRLIEDKAHGTQENNGAGGDSAVSDNSVAERPGCHFSNTAVGSQHVPCLAADDSHADRIRGGIGCQADDYKEEEVG